MNKVTFQKKLYDLIKGKLVERDPPSEETTPHIGKEVRFKLSPIGKTTVDLQDFLSVVEDEYPKLLERLVDRSVQLGESKPLTGATLFITSPNSPICTIAHLPNKEQTEKMKPELQNEAVRQELGMQMNRAIQAYLDMDKHISEGQYGAFYLPLKEAIFFMGFLPEKQTLMIKELVDEGLFENECMATRFVFATAFFPLLESIYNNFKTSQKFKEGKEGKIVNVDYHYNPRNKMLEPIPRTVFQKQS